MHRPAIPSLLLVALLTLSPAASLAGSVEEAERVASQAAEAFQVGRYNQAEELFGQAYDLDPDPVLMMNRGVACWKARRPGEALLHLARLDWKELDPQTTDKIKALINKAAKHKLALLDFSEGRLDEALRGIRDIYAADAEPTLLYDMARCHEGLGHPQEAIRLYREYLEKLPQAEDRETVERLILGVRKRFPGKLRVLSDPEGAMVLIADKPQCTTPCTLKLEEGRYSLTVFKEGYRSHSAMVEVPMKGRRDLFPKLTLEPPAMGTVSISTDVEGAMVFMGQEETSKLLPLKADIPPGRVSLRIEAKGYQPWTGEVLVERDRVAPVKAQLVPEPSRSWKPSWVAWLLMGTGLSTLMAGGITGWAASDQMESAQGALDRARIEEDLNGAVGLRDGAFTMATGANVLYMAGGLALASGVAVWLLAPADN